MAAGAEVVWTILWMVDMVRMWDLMAGVIRLRAERDIFVWWEIFLFYRSGRATDVIHH